jgi:hypothetical protein
VIRRRRELGFSFKSLFLNAVLASFEGDQIQKNGRRSARQLLTAEELQFTPMSASSPLPPGLPSRP